MLINKRTLVVFNLEYEMIGEDGKMVTWKANILCNEHHDNAIEFIKKRTDKPFNLLSIGKVVELDAVTDEAIEYIVKRSGYQTVI